MSLLSIAREATFKRIYNHKYRRKRKVRRATAFELKKAAEINEGKEALPTNYFLPDFNIPRKKLGCRTFPLTAILVFDVDANEIGFAPFVVKNCVLEVKFFMIEKKKNSKLFTLKTKVL